MKMKSVLRFGGLLTVSVVALSGCATSNSTRVQPTASTQSMGLLAESASRAARAQENLARIQAARTAPAPKPVDENMTGVPAELRRPTTIQWSGPGEEAARRIAAIVGFEFRVVGQKPATVPMVDLAYDGQPAVKVLEDLGYQSAPFAQVVADARTRRVEYRYLQSSVAARVERPMSK